MEHRLVSIRVDRSGPAAFVWVICELRDDESDVELAASLKTYASASEAMRAGEQVLRALTPQQRPQA